MIAMNAIARWTPEDPRFWDRNGRSVATRNLWLSIPALTLAFAVWMVWSVVIARLPAIGFSTSHVDQLVAVAISSTRDVGIDVECIDQNVGKKVIADFTHLDEQHSVGGLPRPQEIREFVRLWTLKEAYTKMIGVGHTLDFKTLRFTLDPVDLSSAGDDPKMARAMQFDNFYVSYKHSLFNASLAIRHPVGSVGATKIQIISLAGTAEDNAAT